MMKKKLLSSRKTIKIGFDVDDVLLECSSYAIELTNEKYGTSLRKDKLSYWGYAEGDYEKVFECYNDENFIRTQPPIKGAKEFIERLSGIPGIEVYFITAVPVELTSARSESLKEHFPWIDTKNYILTSSKEVAHFDIFIDDAIHNLVDNQSKYLIVKREKWNENLTGMLSYRNFDELSVLISTICKKEGIVYLDSVREPSVFALIGPSGGGKNDIAQALVDKGMIRPKTYTNSSYEERETHIHVSDKEFSQMEENKDIFTSTIYGKNKYGLKKSEIKQALDRGKNAVVVVDMCGYAALKASFPVVSIYKDEKRENSIARIINRKMAEEEKVNRIISLDNEERNKALCDYVLPAGEPCELSAERIINTIN